MYLSPVLLSLSGVPSDLFGKFFLSKLRIVAMQLTCTQLDIIHREITGKL